MDVDATITLERGSGEVPGVRALLGTALEACEAPPMVATDLCVALSEALTNAVRHGAGDVITVSWRITPTRCEISVRDEGPGFAPPENPTMPEPDALAGRGLPLMNVLADEVDVRSAPGRGTEVYIAQALRSPRLVSLADR
jgi:anti-sigma regulatory factor (Ser/Thr protein kinase)